jgi:hypothetical protein
MRHPDRRWQLALATLGLGACATLAEGGGGDDYLPNARAGPFRELKEGEMGDLRSEPYAIDDDERFLRDPSVIDLDGDPDTLAVIGYFAGREVVDDVDPDPTLEPDRIFVLTALDGRTFGRSPEIALRPDLPWEGGRVGQPSALRLESSEEIIMLYAAEGGIGLAMSPDGGAFDKAALPVLEPAGGWEMSAPISSPGAVVRPDGVIDLFYEVATPTGSRAIGLARSADGRTFERVGGAPILVAAGDELSVASPFAVVAESPEGRVIERLYYSAELADGIREIRLAARVGFEGPMTRALGPVWGIGSKLEPREPCIVPFSRFSLLYVTQKAGSTEALDYPAIAVGLAPATTFLPPPNPL